MTDQQPDGTGRTEHPAAPPPPRSDNRGSESDTPDGDRQSTAGQPAEADPKRPAGAPPENRPGAAANLLGKSKSSDEPHDVGDDEDGDWTDQVAEQQRSERAGDRTIDQAKRSAIAQGDGPAYYVEKQEINYFGRRISVQTQFWLAADIEREDWTYLPGCGYPEMADLLDRRGVLVLRGAAGSGRNATARMLLHGLQCDRIGILTVNDSSLFHVLCEQLDSPADSTRPLMREGDGYVVDRADAAMSEAQLEGFAAAVRKVGARVVVVDQANGEPTAPGFSRPHPWPADRSAVFASHLAAFIRDRRGSDLEEYAQRVRDHSAVLGALSMTSSVLRIVDLARFLVDHAEEDAARDIAEIVSQWEDVARNLARKILRGDAPEEQPYLLPRLVPRQQALRIAYAVFHGQELTYVFSAADLLFQHMICREVRMRPMESRIFDGNLDTLIHKPMVAPTATAAENQPRCARLVAESLMLSILEVAWHEYDQLRDPLLAWLDELAGSPVVEVRTRIAQIAGLMATFDYHTIFRCLIAKWARGKAVYRRSAALAMDQIERNEPWSAVVCKQIQAWADQGRITEQDTAARWYGSRVGRAQVGKAVSALRGLGERADLRHGNSIAEAMSRLFLDGNVDLVADELGRWIGSDNTYLPQHSVRALLILANEDGAGGRAWPRLLEIVDRNPAREAAIVDMWRRALASHTTGDKSWAAIGRWLEVADRDPKLAALVESLALRIFTDQLARRALFNLTVWHKRRPQAQLVRRIHRKLADAGRN